MDKLANVVRKPAKQVCKSSPTVKTLENACFCRFLTENRLETARVVGGIWKVMFADGCRQILWVLSFDFRLLCLFSLLHHSFCKL